jgi:CRISPR-associated protein Csx3
MIKYNEEYQANGVMVVQFELEGGVITPPELAEAITSAPPPPEKMGVIISGRGPVWLFGALTHHFHPSKWVACFDPRLGGGVVTESHTTEVRIGDVIPIQ